MDGCKGGVEDLKATVENMRGSVRLQLERKMSTCCTEEWTRCVLELTVNPGIILIQG